MTILTVDQVLALEDKTPISAVSGVLKKIWQVERGTSKKGKKWTKQNIEFEDSSGGCRIQNWGHPLPASMQGDTVLIQATKGDKGLAGLFVHEYGGTKSIQMNESAKIASNGETTTDGDGRAVQAPTPQDPWEVARKAGEGARISTIIALEVARALNDEFKTVTGIPVTPEQINSWASSINYYMRDQGCFKHIKLEGTDEPPQSGLLQPPITIGSQVPADEDEIPF
jgi:hypothetical protein